MLLRRSTIGGVRMNDETLRTIVLRAADRQHKTEYFKREMLKRLKIWYDLDAPPIPGSAWNNVAWLSSTIQWPRDYGVVAAKTAERRGDVADSFELQCNVYEALEDYLVVLLRDLGTPEQFDGDSLTIAAVKAEMVEQRAVMVSYHGAKAEQYFESKS